jgi:hypothetical protein
MSFEMSALLVSWVAILLLALVVSGLVRQVNTLASGQVQVRSDEMGLRQGAPAPEFERLVPARTGAVLLFLSEGCGSCEEVLEEALSLGAEATRRGVAVTALFPTSSPALPAAATRNGLAGVPVLEGEATLFERYKIPATPFGVEVSPAGRVVRSEPVGSREALRQALERAAAPDAAPV